MRVPWPIEVEALGAATPGTILWKHAGRSTLTVVVKATFTMDEGVARLAAPGELALEERFLPQTRSLLCDADIAPYKPRAEITFIGSAWSAAQTPQVQTRLAVSGSSPLFDRSLLIFGDRAGPSGPPAPFRTLPILWDRAWADPMSNPIGVPRGSGRLPNIVDPTDENAPASYGPISRTWGTRARFVGAGDPRRSEGTRPEMPAELSWGLFLAAPVEQQVSRLQGDEAFLLENLIEGRPRVCTQLPGARAVARYHGPNAPRDGAAIAMRLDTISINGYDRTIHLLWRGTMAFPNEAAAPASRVVAGIEMPGTQAVFAGAASTEARPPPATTRMTTKGLGPASPAQTEKPPEPKYPKDSGTMPVGRQIISVPKITDDVPLYDLDDPESSSGSTMAIDPEAAMKMLAGAKATPWEQRQQPPPAPPPPAAPPPAPPPPAAAPPPPAPPPPAPPPAAPAPAPERQAPRTVPVPGPAPGAQPPAMRGFPPVVVRPAGADIDDDDSVGSTMAITPEAAAELMARRGGGTGQPPQPVAPAAPAGAQRTPARTRPPTVPLPAPPPPMPPAPVAPGPAPIPPAPVPPPPVPPGAFHSPTNVTKDGRHGTMEMEPVPDSDTGGGTMVLRPEDFAKKR